MPDNLENVNRDLKEMRDTADKTKSYTGEMADKAEKAFNKGRGLVMGSTKDALQSFKTEMDLWKTITNEQVAKGQKAFEKLTPTIDDIRTQWEKMTVSFNNAKEDPQAAVGQAIESSGLGKIIDTASEWANKVWDYLKPQLAKLAKIPGIAWLIGEENAKMLEVYFAGDIETEKLFGEIKKRLPDNVAFVGNVNDTKNLTAFNDAFEEVKAVKGGDYNKTKFFMDVAKDESMFRNLDQKDDKKLLSMKEIAVAAKKFATETVKNAPPKAPEAAKNAPVELKANAAGKIEATQDGKKLEIERQANGSLKITDKGTWMIVAKKMMPLNILTIGVGPESSLTGKVKNPLAPVPPMAPNPDQPEEIAFSLPKEKVALLFENINSGKTYEFKNGTDDLEFKKVA